MTTIQKISISNILGVESMEFRPGAGMTAIVGANGQGKTSVLEAIKSVTGRGHDATLLRKGADQGEVVLVLDNGTTLREQVTATKTTRDVIRDGKKQAKPSDTIQALTDALSVNPVEFLRATKKDRVKVLLESMPLKADAARLTQITGIPVEQTDSHALQLIEAVRKQVFDDRTGTNRALQEKAATINQLKLAMPDAPEGVDPNASEDELLAQVKAAVEARDAELQRVATKLDGIKTESAKKREALTAEAQAKIDAIRAELQAALDAEVATQATIAGKAQEQRERTKAKCQAAVEPVNQALAAIRANRGAAAKREQALETIRTMEQHLGELEGDAAKQTAALTQLDAYKSELLSSLPIPGLEVIDGEVFRDGITFDRLNTAQQVRIAIEIAALRAGELQVCCVDQLEVLDSEQFEQVASQAEEMGLQLFVTRVTDGDISVQTNAQE